MAAMAAMAPILDPDPSYCWVPTEIQRCSDLVDGQKWIESFEAMLKDESKETPAGARPRRSLRSTLSDGDAPHFWSSATVADAVTTRGRNEVLRKMHTPPARKVVLPNKQEVLFWFNIGPARENRDRVYVTEANCPHQGVCLLSGELKDIEDLAGPAAASAGRRGMVRCPRHNKTFDLASGESLGALNCEVLQTFPSRFQDGRFYVRVPTDQLISAQEQETDSTDVEMKDATMEPELKRPRFDQLPTPTRKHGRSLCRHTTLG
ncbi:unnamed protein product [Cladocopium goreaui]|uniref:6-pyruvoyltetrahydropterin synthase n=1 Tax=Cladocopium goreaui TaxID=2562237 RepID=A0A9P1FM99_9DINO|nr:unnamed protein product [Cladocopium goreaui]